MTKKEFRHQNWHCNDTIILSDGTQKTVFGVGFSNCCVSVKNDGGKYEWISCEYILKHYHDNHLDASEEAEKASFIRDWDLDKLKKAKVCLRDVDVMRQRFDKMMTDLEKSRGRMLDGKMETALKNITTIIGNASGLHNTIDRFVAQMQSANDLLTYYKENFEDNEQKVL